MDPAEILESSWKESHNVIVTDKYTSTSQRYWSAASKRKQTKHMTKTNWKSLCSENRRFPDENKKYAI